MIYTNHIIKDLAPTGLLWVKSRHAHRVPGRNEPARALAHTRSHKSKGQHNNHKSHHITAHRTKVQKGRVDINAQYALPPTNPTPRHRTPTVCACPVVQKPRPFLLLRSYSNVQKGERKNPHTVHHRCARISS
jgi:hypothetical protein